MIEVNHLLRCQHYCKTERSRNAYASKCEKKRSNEKKRSLFPKMTQCSFYSQWRFQKSHNLYLEIF